MSHGFKPMAGRTLAALVLLSCYPVPWVQHQLVRETQGTRSFFALGLGLGPSREVVMLNQF